MDFSFLADPGFWVVIGTIAGIYALMSVGLQMQVGYGGMLNFGQVGFMAVGAYGMAIASDRGWSLLPSMAVGIGLAVVLALLLGIPTVSLRADYMSIVTIAAGEIVRYTANNLGDLTGGPRGILGSGGFRQEVREPLIDFFQAIGIEKPEKLLPLLVCVWAAVLLATGLSWYLTRSPWGRVLRAVREDEDAVRALGKNAFIYKLQVLILGGVFGALAGQAFAMYLGYISPQAFQPVVTFLGFVIIIVAGLGSLWGVPVAATLIILLYEGTRYLDLPISDERLAAARFIVVGLVLMLLVALRPHGLFGKHEEMVLEKQQ